MSTRIGIVGYGNLGRGVESAVRNAPDMELAAIFTRRNPAGLSPVTPGIRVLPVDALPGMAEALDVLILCGGSASDLPKQTPRYARLFNVVDSFDTHADISKHFDAVDAAARAGGKTAVISVGWDPGLFSLSRLYAEAVLPHGTTSTFWGKGVSQGHSDAIRRVPGVRDARQYTIPIESALDAVRAGSAGALTARQMHRRECFVVAEEGADKAAIEQAIVTMPNYFEPYDTVVHFLSQEELDRDHSGIPHGGFVIRSGKTGLHDEHSHTIEYRLQLDSNPEFTSSVLLAFARAAVRLDREGCHGCKTALDIPPTYLSPESGEALRRRLV